jgi:translocation and assembly module TamA
LAQSELDVRIKPANDALKANIEGYIGGVGERDEEALLRFSRGAEEQARKGRPGAGLLSAAASIARCSPARIRA